jgi:hypothetical protein
MANGAPAIGDEPGNASSTSHPEFGPGTYGSNVAKAFSQDIRGKTGMRCSNICEHV